MSSKVKGLSLDRLDRKILVSLTQELAEWLDYKATQGYKKATLIRKVLEEYRRMEVMQDGGNRKGQQRGL
jgi:hypothetical protein